MDKITLKNMKFFAYHGVYPEEKAQGQNFHIDVEMRLDLRKPGNTDNLEDTIDYSRVYGIIKYITESNRFQLIERLADSISREILTGFDRIGEITVCIRKPEAPMDGVLDWAAVEIRRSRHDL